MRYLVNKVIYNVLDKPYQHEERDCPADCKGECPETCRIQDSDCPNHPCTKHRTYRNSMISDWIQTLLMQMGGGMGLTGADIDGIGNIIRACKEATKGNSPHITVEDGDWKWLSRVLLSDDEGKRLLPERSAQRGVDSEGHLLEIPGRPAASGCYLANCINDLWLAGQLKLAIEEAKQKIDGTLEVPDPVQLEAQVNSKKGR